MKTRPMLFSGAMVRAILNGSKTQTRRVMKPQLPKGLYATRIRYEEHPFSPSAFVGTPAEGRVAGQDRMAWVAYDWVDNPVGVEEEDWLKCPYGVPGDRLWVREAWRIGAWREDDGVVAIDYSASPEITKTPWLLAPSDWFNHNWERNCEELGRKGINPSPDGFYHWEPGQSPLGWKPSIHMPRWASRITLEIVSVRVERLQEISAYDAICEGVEFEIPAGADPKKQNFPDGFDTWHEQKQNRWFEEIARATYMAQCVAGERAIAAYRTLWESINGPGSWDANPFVWVVEFKRVEVTA